MMLAIATLARRWRVAILACLSLVLCAKEQHLKYENDMQVYELEFNDQKISAAEMRQIVQFSPYLWVDIPSPFTAIKSWNNNQIDRQFIVPWLELENPAYSESGTSSTIRPAFLKHAALNLKRGREEVALLRSLKVPEVLAPVRSYLLQNLEFSLAIEEARYAYFKTGDIGPLRRILCEECPCDEGQERILGKLKDAPNGAARLRISRYKWQNQVLDCRRPHAGTYPIEAWKQFVKQFGIQESYHFKHVD